MLYLIQNSFSSFNKNISDVSKYNNVYFVVILFIRWLVDALDGEVARKYNKTSKIGGLLDTISDFILLIIILHFFVIKFKLNKCVYPIVISFSLFYLFCVDGFIEHKNMKNNGNIIAFLMNNGIILVLVMSLIYIVLNKRKTLII